ncbi:hypothetical protein JNUCC1_00428 [Lentibacillus sp. JNUCC-1]|uniref:cupin domain-containing protein n=1 Tax=Lentibacillus sp. JNUCC-1 TaxID=2654513 RepID=UPI001325C260|nr:cupin domain-containing protein [Lentibacillus sp. JNUCC-1]MUV36625.1 hypothetical protein [Lentibacillus sp. JNUCC-1]
MEQSKRQHVIGDEHMGYSYELLAKSRFSSVEPTIVHVTPKDQNVRHDPYTHTEDEFIYILQGTIELFYDDDTYEMSQGDTAYFKGSKPHLFVPVDNIGAKVLTIFIENP